MIIGCLALGATFRAPGFAALVVASGAGPLPGSAQDLTAYDGVTEVVGALDFPLGVDMFKINISFPPSFFAYTIFTGAFGVPDPELFLFDANGFGVLMNDDATGSDTQACLPSVGGLNACPAYRGNLGPLSKGIYYLAITRSANFPLSNSGYIFSPLLSTDVVGPDLTSGGGDPIVGWDNGVNTSPNFDQVNFDLVISDAPEPVTSALVAGSGLALLLYGKRRAR